MNRRRVLKGLAAGAAIAGAGFRLPAVAAGGYTGKLFVVVQADGAWDPTSFCDPKENTAGEPEINHWARTATTQQAGRVPYAPFAGNRAFFEKYHRRMLVINGVDAQTNSHSVGVTHNWSGRNAEGFPTLTALLAAHHAPRLPLNYLNFGGFAATEGVTRYTRLWGGHQVKSLAWPNREVQEEGLRVHWPDDWSMLLDYRARRIARLNAAPGLLPRQARNRHYYAQSLDPEAGELLRAFAATLPLEEHLEPVLEATVGNKRHRSELRRQAQLAVLAFRAGAAVSADLYLGGFDTHTANDDQQRWLLSALTDGVDFLWDYAERNGVADRMVVVMGSDFGRTNFYNAENGKDHWPIGSYVVMEKNQRWTNRVVGETDSLHFAKKISPATLRRDDSNGTIIYPKHVHKALRSYLGVAGSPYARRFPFNNTEDFGFFSA